MTTRTEILRTEDPNVAAEISPTQYLTFRIASETYAVGILQVREIVQYEALTAVPSTPRSIRGVMNLRGVVVAVVDLAVKFGLPPSAVTKRTCVIILELELQGERSTIGVMADAVNEVLQLSPEDVQPPPPFGTRVRADYLVGLVESERGFTLILNLERLLATDELRPAPEAPAPHAEREAAASSPSRTDAPIPSPAPAGSPKRPPSTPPLGSH